MTNSSQPHGLYSPWHSLGQEPGGGSLSFLQEIFPAQGSNPGLPHCRQILYWLSHKGSPRILEWVAYSFSSRSSQPRNRTGFSCIAGRFFTNWAIREAQHTLIKREPNNHLDFPVAQMVRNPPALWETWVQSLGWEDPLDEEMATNSSSLAWKTSMDRGAWQAKVHGVTKSYTWLSD